MRRVAALLLLFGILVYGIWPLQGADAISERKVILWDASHFYFYNERGEAERLPLAGKIAVRFGTANIDERDALLKRLNAVSVVPDKIDPTLSILTFQNGVTENNIVAVLREVSAFGIVEAYPVVIKDNLEAVAEGVLVRPKTYLSEWDLRIRLAKYGRFAVREVKEINGAYQLFFEWIEPPLNLYLFANLVHKDAWVSLATPIFRYLESEVTALLRVEPATGTLAEMRTITLEIFILNPRLVLREDLLVKFNEADFIPKANGTPRLEKLFSIVGDEKKSIVRRGRATVVSFSWQFKHYEVGKRNPQQAQGDWVVAGPKIILSEGEEGRAVEITASSASFSVMSLIGTGAIPDMPPPRFIPLPADRIAVSVENKPFAGPTYIFDRWLYDPLRAARHARLSAFALFGFAAIFLSVPVVRFGHGRLRNAAHVNRFVSDLRTSVERAKTGDPAESYQILREVTALLLSRAFAVAPHPTMKHIEEMRSEIAPELFARIQALFTALEEQDQPDFSPDRDRMVQIGDLLVQILAGLRSRLQRTIRVE